MQNMWFTHPLVVKVSIEISAIANLTVWLASFSPETILEEFYFIVSYKKQSYFQT